MVSLDSLASELLLEIMSHLISAADLISLSLQCRRFSKLAAARLQLIRPFHRVRITLDQDIGDIYQFLITILRNRSLGLYTEQMEIDIRIKGWLAIRRQVINSGNWDAEEYKLAVDVTREIDFYDRKNTEEVVLGNNHDGTLVNIPFYPDGVILAFLNGKRSNLEDSQFLNRFKQKSFTHSVVSLFPVVFPNVKFLKLSPATSGAIINIFRIINDSRKSKCLRNLRHVRVFGPDYATGRDTLEFLASYHQLPFMETLSVERLTVSRSRTTDYSQDPDSPTPMATATESNISKIYLTRCNIPSELLTPILKPPKALEEFKYSIRSQGSSDASLDHIDPTILGHDLRVHRSTLRVLDIDVDECGRCSDSGSRVDDGESTTPVPLATAPATGPPVGIAMAGGSPSSHAPRVVSSIGSLHGFTALTHLSIGVNFLLGPDRNEVKFADYWEENYPEEEEERLRQRQQQQQQWWRYNTPFTYESPPLVSPLVVPSSSPSPARRRLIDRLPPNLEFLCIRGYKRGEAGGRWTSMISELMDRKADCFPRLKEVVGVMEYIPSAVAVVSDGADDVVVGNDVNAGEGEMII
ncbi:hypothetical protein GX50_06830 [[Emmonsia] crescens]|uniref:F-box domain-containing protein n=1 Tax=[Emmonsia] crescens TaxID=73230 RepID=A0A2B7Z225_9EURO|nr:hypothetical protein GX50_06830 [Emmonsia crescens]